MTKKSIHRDNQVVFARDVDASYRKIQALMTELTARIEHQLRDYDYDNAIAGDLNRLTDVSDACVCDLSHGLHDAALASLMTYNDVLSMSNSPRYMDYLPDSINDPDRGTYGEWR